jgi:mRNA interferase RelE/StbE
MRFEIVLAPDASKALQRLPARARSEVRDALERHLRFEPTKTSKSRIKRLRGLSQPQYRLRVNDIRVFYDVTETSVEILAIIEKQEAQDWLDQEGTPGESGGAGQG